MATVTMQGAFDFANAPSWTVLTVFGTPTVLNISDPLKFQTFYGSFVYSGTTSDPQVNGSVERITLAVGNSAMYDITGLDLDAAQLQQLVLTPDGAQQFYAYVLGGNDRFAGSAGGTLRGYGGNDTLGGGMTGTFDGGAGSDTVAALQTVAIAADLGAGRVTQPSVPGSGVLRLISVENLIGSDLNDTLAGSAGPNRLDGRAGFDTVSYAAATTAVQVDLAAGTGRGAGNDTLLGIENAVGGRGADLLSGSNVANRFDGGTGADTMRGGLGNDSYVIDQRGDVIVEAAAAGTDTVFSPFNLVLAATLENLVLTGEGVLSGTGNVAANRINGNLADNWLLGLDGADTLNGGAGDDTLDGGSGADSLSGGLGDDFYRIDHVRDVIGDERGGNDAVAATVSFALGSLEIERLRLDGTAAIDATGNGLANVLVGNVAANVLDGGGGADTLQGGAGDDVYLLDQAGDRVLERPGEGADRVRSSVNCTLGADLENLDLLGYASVGTGNGQANRIAGNAVENLLDGGAGADTLAGGAGNDRYLVDNAGDVVNELGGGQDLVQSAVDWVLGSNLEDLTLVGSAVAGTGNGAANTIRGNALANRLDGKGGADTLIGGMGNDSYVVDAGGDVLLEYAGEGIDSVISSVSWTLETYYHIERLELGGTAAIDGVGNWLANRLIGNAAANRLDGGAGVDTLAGGAGDDHYVVDQLGELVIERAGGGYDTIETTVSSLVLADHVEKGVLRDGAYAPTLTGNTLANLLIGSSAADTLDGAAGADTLRGGAGSDTYLVDDAFDVVIDDGVGGSDVLLSTIDILAPSAGIEVHRLAGSGDLRVTGGAGNDDLGGNDGANQLDGGSGGADTLRGGAGDDTYLVNHESTLIDEAAGGGDDLVLTSVSLTTYAEIERITLTGSADIDVTCFNAGVVLTGNAGSNELVGAYGHATVSYANAGGAVAVDLQAGSASGFGNDVLVGIRAVIGSGFDDTIRGGADDDRLSGGAGADRFVLWNTMADTVRDFQAGSDVLAIDQSDLAIGNGDLVIDGATSLSAPGGFAPQAELVLGAVTAGSAALAQAAAAAIGSANAAYAPGQSTLFAVQGSDGVGLYRFVAADADALVEAAELQLLAILDGTTAVSSADFAWIA